jgi:type IV secretion system protein VirB4
MSTSRQLLLPDLAHEASAGLHLPYSHHVDERTLALRDGALMQVLRLDGLPFETADTAELNYRKSLREAMLRAIASPRFAVYQHVVRRRVDVGLAGNFADGFSAGLDALWNARLARKQLFVNDLFLTLVRRPSAARAGFAPWLAGVFGAVGSNRAEAQARAAQELRALSAAT